MGKHTHSVVDIASTLQDSMDSLVSSSSDRSLADCGSEKKGLAYLAWGHEAMANPQGSSPLPGLAPLHPILGTRRFVAPVELSLHEEDR